MAGSNDRYATSRVNGNRATRQRSSRAERSPTFCVRTCGLTGTHFGCEHGVWRRLHRASQTGAQSGRA